MNKYIIILTGLILMTANLLADRSQDPPSHLINPKLSEENIAERLEELMPLGAPEEKVRKFIKDHDTLYISDDGLTKGERDRGLKGFTVFVGKYKSFPFIPVSNYVYVKILFDEKGRLSEFVVMKIADGI